MTVFGGMTGKMVQLGQRNSDALAVLETPESASQRRYPMTVPQSTPAPESMQEEWRPVVGYEGLYEVSNFGRVQTLRRNRPLKATPSHGYPTVGLWSNRKRQTRRVHVLVAAAFIGPCPPGKEVNHIDSNPANSRADNLEYLTHAENMVHCVRAGRHHNVKLTDDDVRVIRVSTASYRAMAKHFGVNKQTIYNIRKGTDRRYVK